MVDLSLKIKKIIYFCFIDYAKAFDYVGHNKLWKILKEMGIPDHLTCLLRNLYAGQEATVSTGHGTTDWFQIRKGVRQGCILSLCLHYAKCQAAWSTSWNQDCREISISSDVQMTLPLMVESEDELKSLLIKVKEEIEKARLKLNSQ